MNEPKIVKTFNYNDGGRDKYFKGTTGDCVTRAIAIACNLDYKKVYDDLFALNKEYANSKRNKVAKAIKKGRGKSPRDGIFKEVYHDYILKHGFEWIPTMTIGSGCKTHLHHSELPKGTLIARVSRHLCAVIDGCINDTYDCSREGKRCVYGYYIASPIVDANLTKEREVNMKTKISKDELVDIKKQGFDNETISKLFDIEKTRTKNFTVENERQNAIKVLSPISNLSQKERERVLVRALKMNKV